MFLSSLYVFNIYEVDFRFPAETKPGSTFKITIIPLNSLGKKVPFRSVSYELKILEGKDLISVLDDDKKGTVGISVGEKNGLIKLYVRTDKSAAPSIIEIPVKNLGES